ncbi:DUF6090 family protein [Winogradskyella ouciana]|uniref:Uncharacterized protein n=1 Tax=Winogradskyella ouciana TaxID=2608631 RepID=A0A7K1GFQ6_9FLAO|nr:DUF6090 family protein [Winogradskyella ouciana]MTE27855.1 hypothetical protein [Winogradskyella ouciana]
MIKFFRHIRQSMINQNRTKKYLLYAIGEIILVVIGILIALQINNWNENKKLRNQEITYLHNLKGDLKTQISMLDVYIDYENIIIDHSNDIIEHFELNGGFDDMDSVFPKLNDLTTRWTFSNANTTLLQMLNSNQINIIQNTELKEELIAFNQQIDLFAKNTNINNTNLVDNLTTDTFVKVGGFASYGNSERMVKKFNDFYPFKNKTVNDNELKALAIQIINQPKNKLEIINKVSYRNTISSLQKSGNEALRVRTEQILKMINNEIDMSN